MRGGKEKRDGWLRENWKEEAHLGGEVTPNSFIKLENLFFSLITGMKLGHTFDIVYRTYVQG